MLQSPEKKDMHQEIKHMSFIHLDGYTEGTM